MKNKDAAAMKEQLLTLIPEGNARRVSLNYLQRRMNISKREVKELIAQVRIEVPICAQETDGGGYWVAETDLEIKEFIAMIARHRDAYNKTISIMQDHLIDINPIGGKLF